jgi:hypothetical protein
MFNPMFYVVINIYILYPRKGIHKIDIADECKIIYMKNRVQVTIVNINKMMYAYNQC